MWVPPSTQWCISAGLVDLVTLDAVVMDVHAGRGRAPREARWAWGQIPPRRPVIYRRPFSDRACRCPPGVLFSGVLFLGASKLAQNGGYCSTSPTDVP